MLENNQLTIEEFLKDTKILKEMQKRNIMIFVKECCKNNESVLKTINNYDGCFLEWCEEIDEYVVFTVVCGILRSETVIGDANEYLTISINKNTKEVFCLSNYLHNYSGYKIYLKREEKSIKQNIGYGFGSWRYNTLNLDLTEKESYSEHDYGCCCD